MRKAKKGKDQVWDWLDLAKRAARKAGLAQMEHLERDLEYEFKGVSNLVTKVDLLCEREIIGTIRLEAPEHNILSEEQGGDSLESEYIWVIDPLDGTTNYAHGYLRFCVSIALVSRGKPILGVIYDPAMNELFHTIKGDGAFLNGKRIRVSKVDKVADALLVTGFSYDRGSDLERDLRLYNQIHPYPQSIRRDGSAALDLCYLACGRFDGFWEFNLNSWDVAAGSLLVEEAGGKVTDLKGRPMPLDKQELWASNGRIHREFLELINREAGK